MKKPFKIAAALLLSTALSVSAVTPFAYQNGSSLEGQWADSRVEYGIGDPYMMKYNGMFYLYCSTYDPDIGVKVWSSPDMVNWTYEGLCSETTDQVMKGAYAPEVTYWNGTFYMYTAAPGGDQHRVLTSKSPLGPFIRQNDVFTDPDDLIDGSVFIDDNEDATKYFLHAGGSCIEYGTLNDNMLTGTGKNRLDAATVIGHWTEGPSVFKRNGKYYMTYCGNHVNADNYMIEYVAGDSLTGMKEPEQNLLLINTEEGITGLGHNSIVVGPDLDSRYIVYHNLVSNTNAPERRLNIDRMIFNGEKLEVQGPTWWEMDNPKMPEFYDRMANGDHWNVTGKSSVKDGTMTLTGSSRALSKQSTPADYTAEFNLWLDGAGAKAGGIVSYENDQNYAFAYLDPASNTLCLDTVVNGAKSSKSAKLPKEYAGANDVLRKLTVKKEGKTFDIYADDRLLITAEADLGGGKIGLEAVSGSAKFGYTAFSSTVNGNQDKDTVKPTGSAMNAVHANDTSRTFETGTITESKAGLDSQYVKGVKAGDSLTFKINPEKTAYYSAEILAKAQAGTKISLKVDGQEVVKSASLTQSDAFFTDVVRSIRIAEDAKEVTLTVTSGSMDFYSLKLAKEADIFKGTEKQSGMDYEWLDGAWSDDKTTISATDSSVWSTAGYGSENWGDYEYEADVKLKSGSDAGLMVRMKYATDSSDSKNGIGGCNSPDYHFGYYAFLKPNGVYLGKQMFDWKQVASAPMTLSNNKNYRMKVRAEGANIKIWLDGQLKIDYTDTSYPIMSGKVGMRVMNGTASYQNISLTHLNVTSPLTKPITLEKGATPITKEYFKTYSNGQGKGFELKEGGIDFNNGKRSAKGYLTEEVPLDSTVSCDLQLPGTGGFGVGLLVRCKPGAFGEGVDALDGLGVQLERGENGSVDVKAYAWENGAWKGALATKNLPGFFTDQQPRTAKLTVTTVGNTLTAFVDGEECLKFEFNDLYSDGSRSAVGFRSHLSAHVMLTNFTYSAAGEDPKEEPAPESVTVTLDKTSIEAGKTAKATAQVTPDQVSQEVTWSSSDIRVAAVDQNGTVAGVAAGKASIMAMAPNGVFQTVEITVTGSGDPVDPTNPDPETVTITLDKSSIKAGGTAKATAKVLPNDADQEVTWSSSDTKVAAIDENGVITGVAAGKATITATASNGVTGSAEITVTEKDTPTEPEDPSEPTDPEEPSDPNEPSQPEKPVDPQHPDDNGSQNGSPQTGVLFPIGAGAAVIISLCGAALTKKRKK